AVGALMLELLGNTIPAQTCAAVHFPKQKIQTSVAIQRANPAARGNQLNNVVKSRTTYTSHSSFFCHLIDQVKQIFSIHNCIEVLKHSLWSWLLGFTEGLVESIVEYMFASEDYKHIKRFVLRMLKGSILVISM